MDKSCKNNSNKGFYKSKDEQLYINIVTNKQPEVNPPFSNNLQDIDYLNQSQVTAYLNQNSKFKEDIRVGTFLNRGSCGVVYSGEIKRCGNKKAALKLLVSNKINKEKREKREKILKREIQIMNKLKHKNSINLYGMYDVGEKETYCIVMEFAKYGDIENFQKLIQKRTLNETLLAYLTRQILYGLLNCKRNNILHLDIKQQNILIDENLVAKLSDFSVSYDYTKLEQEKQTITLPLVGTSLFMSPEILSRQTVKIEDAHKVDLYSLGAFLYNLAYNKYPYSLDIKDKKNFFEIENKIKKNILELPILSKHSNIFRDFLKGVLEKNIDTRLSINQALNHKWIKSAELINEEKEKIGDLEKFLINLVTDNIRAFNEAIKH